MFQVKLGGEWKSYAKDEDKILKRAFMAGFPKCKFHLRGQDYEYSFDKMKQKNVSSGKERDIRPPFKWKAPSKPLVTPGKTTVVTVQPGQPGTTIQVPYPGKRDLFISVNVPASAKAGQAMLVPVPNESECQKAADAPAAESGGGGGWSTGAKVAAGTTGVAAAAGVGVAGAILGMHAAEHGVDATVDMVGDGAVDAGEAIADAAVDAGEFIGDGAEELGDFIMDLF